MNRFSTFHGIFWLIMLFTSCTGDDTNLILDEDYLFVSDVLHYCQGSCDVYDDWENADVFVKGYLKDFGNDSIQQNNRDKSRFYRARAMKRCGFCNGFFKLVICLLIVQYIILNTTAAMLYEPVLATGRFISPSVGADILIPPFW